MSFIIIIINQYFILFMSVESCYKLNANDHC